MAIFRQSTFAYTRRRTTGGGGLSAVRCGYLFRRPQPPCLVSAQLKMQYSFGLPLSVQRTPTRFRCIKQPVQGNLGNKSLQNSNVLNRFCHMRVVVFLFLVLSLLVGLAAAAIVGATGRAASRFDGEFPGTTRLFLSETALYT